MNPITILFDVLTIAACTLAVSGCGKEFKLPISPVPEPSIASSDLPAADPAVASTPVPTATPTPNPTTVTYIYQATTICAAMHSWNPNTTTIKTYPTAGNTESAFYLFRWDGVWYVVDGSEYVANVTLTRSNINAVVCTITVANGALTGVTP